MRSSTVVFATRFSRPDVIASPRGNGERSIFEERIVDGVKELVVTGKENFKDFIEASKAETLISNIMKRFEQGDVSVLSRVQGFYGDVTGMPSNLAEAQNLLINLENQFNSFPSDIKLKFDNSFDKYVQTVSTSSMESVADLLNLKPIETKTVESEVINNDEK